MLLLFLIGSYVDRAGQRTEAIDYWKRCLRERYFDGLLNSGIVASVMRSRF